MSLILCGSHVDTLGNDRFQIREKSDKLLRDVGWFAVPSLETKGMNSSDAEIRCRSKEILDNYYLMSPKSGMYPTIDLLYPEDKFTLGWHLDTLVAEITKDVEQDQIIGVPGEKEVLRRLFKRGLKAGIPKFVFRPVMDHLEKKRDSVEKRTRVPFFPW